MKRIGESRLRRTVEEKKKDILSVFGEIHKKSIHSFDVEKVPFTGVIFKVLNESKKLGRTYYKAFNNIKALIYELKGTFFSSFDNYPYWKEQTGEYHFSFKNYYKSAKNKRPTEGESKKFQEDINNETFLYKNDEKGKLGSNSEAFEKFIIRQFKGIKIKHPLNDKCDVFELKIETVKGDYCRLFYFKEADNDKYIDNMEFTFNDTDSSFDILEKIKLAESEKDYNSVINSLFKVETISDLPYKKPKPREKIGFGKTTVTQEEVLKELFTQIKGIDNNVEQNDILVKYTANLIKNEADMKVYNKMRQRMTRFLDNKPSKIISGISGKNLNSTTTNLIKERTFDISSKSRLKTDKKNYEQQLYEILVNINDPERHLAKINKLIEFQKKVISLDEYDPKSEILEIVKKKLEGQNMCILVNDTFKKYEFSQYLTVTDLQNKFDNMIKVLHKNEEQVINIEDVLINDKIYSDFFTHTVRGRALSIILKSILNELKNKRSDQRITKIIFYENLKDPEIDYEPEINEFNPESYKLKLLKKIVEEGGNESYYNQETLLTQERDKASTEQKNVVDELLDKLGKNNIVVLAKGKYEFAEFTNFAELQSEFNNIFAKEMEISLKIESMKSVLAKYQVFLDNTKIGEKILEFMDNLLTDLKRPVVTDVMKIIIRKDYSYTVELNEEPQILPKSSYSDNITQAMALFLEKKGKSKGTLKEKVQVLKGFTEVNNVKGFLEALYKDVPSGGEQSIVGRDYNDYIDILKNTYK